MHLALNLTHIVLIPKNDNPEFASGFRPISLCNLIYKPVSKVICNKLKTVMLLIISLQEIQVLMTNVTICNKTILILAINN